MIEEKALNIWTNIYFTSLIIAAIAGALSIVAGFVQNKLNDSIQTKLRKDIAIANENASKATLQANEVEKQNIELRQKFANRRITEKQNKIMVEELSKQPSSFNIETMGDSESGLFAADILKTFENAGWQVDKKEFPLGVIWIGLLIYRTNDPAALVIADAFKEAGLEFKIADQFKEKATIMVGGRPPIF